MSAATRWWVLVLGAATCLVAAKAHGRQLRLERELAGYWQVTFGGENPAWVEALWRRERWLYWGLAGLIAAGMLGYRLLASRLQWPLLRTGASGGPAWVGALALHVLIPLASAFIITGLLSLARLALAARGDTVAAGAGWWSAALWGSAGWWTLTLAMGAALVFLAWRRAA